MGGDWESQYPLQHRQMAGDCIDLVTERQNVKDYINGSGKIGVDGAFLR